MTKNETIARLARRVEKQRKCLKVYSGTVTQVYRLLYDIGGPLNDNNLKFSGPQLQLLQQIAKELDWLK